MWTKFQVHPLNFGQSNCVFKKSQQKIPTPPLGENKGGSTSSVAILAGAEREANFTGRQNHSNTYDKLGPEGRPLAWNALDRMKSHSEHTTLVLGGIWVGTV